MGFDNTYAKIDLDAISKNYDAICRKAGKPVMAVVKANAYGHGAVAVARLLENRCPFFGVANIMEALELRKAGIQKPILILGHTPADAFPAAIMQDIRLTIFRREDALALSRAAQALQKTALLHFAVDTGMSRIGFQATAEDADTCAAIAAYPGICAEGLFSHFAAADCTDLSRTLEQAEQFAGFDRLLQQRGVRIPLRHLDNSAGIMHFGCRWDMSRAGIILYGLYPSDALPPDLLPLHPAMSLYSRIINLRLLPPGRSISYGGTFVTDRPTQVATLAVGYADGYRRNLSNRFYVLIRGKKAPILGRICMDQLMVDVTDIPDARQGDEAVLIGSSGTAHISMDDISAQADSFNYEFACGINRRVPRIYIQNGEEVSAVHYLAHD